MHEYVTHLMMSELKYAGRPPPQIGTFSRRHQMHNFDIITGRILIGRLALAYKYLTNYATTVYALINRFEFLNDTQLCVPKKDLFSHSDFIYI